MSSPNPPDTPRCSASTRTRYDDAQLAAMSFLAHYSGRTLEAYRYDLRCFFQWAADSGIAVLDATRAHIEVYPLPARGPGGSRRGRWTGGCRRCAGSSVSRTSMVAPPPSLR
ncbi:MAG: hypothetical protein M5U19_13290 [Microthrixaceae bacterium]|nr:hypothetical protein [Microthrixaceae bacterium]